MSKVYKLAMGEPISKVQTAERVRAIADAIEEEIVLGWLLPRERLIEEELARRLEVKRHVVREALAELERVGLVERVPNKGAVVRMLEPQEIRQIYSVREVLETLAAEQIPLPASPELLGALGAIQTRHAAAVAGEDPRSAFRANMAFHQTLFAACGNGHLVELIQMMAQKVHGARSITAASPEHLARARDEHAAMIEALERGDRKGLVRLCREHIGPSRDAYIAAVERRRPQAALRPAEPAERG